MREVLGDTAYGDGDTREAVEAAGAKVTAKTQPPSPIGRFTKNDFVIDPDNPSAICPAGHTTTVTGSTTDHKRRRVTVLKFPDELCQACPLRAACTASTHGRWVTRSTSTRLASRRHGLTSNARRSNGSCDDARSSSASWPKANATGWARPATAAPAKSSFSSASPSACSTSNVSSPSTPPWETPPVPERSRPRLRATATHQSPLETHTQTPAPKATSSALT